MTRELLFACLWDSAGSCGRALSRCFRPGDPAPYCRRRAAAEGWLPLHKNHLLLGLNYAASLVHRCISNAGLITGRYMLRV